MARRPPNVAWLGFTQEQARLLNFLDPLGNNGRGRNSQTEELMPVVMDDCEKAGLTLAQSKAAMKSIGYGKVALHQLDRWESKHTSGKLGRQLRRAGTQSVTVPGHVEAAARSKRASRITGARHLTLPVASG